MVLYTTAKTALGGFSRAQALEWAPNGVRVHPIAPGILNAPWQDVIAVDCAESGCSVLYSQTDTARVGDSGPMLPHCPDRWVLISLR
jgi:NAD(P)-dependent dehydrogenase (short-subunit alcohol dehydrogenase family)